MTAAQYGWTVAIATDSAAVYRSLAEDRIWNGYCIGDLEAPFWEYATFALARRGGTAPAAVCLLLRFPTFTSIVAHGDPDGFAAILANVELPAVTEWSVREEHLPGLRRHYELSRTDQMCRMAVSAETFAPPPRRDASPQRLGPADADTLTALYTAYPGAVFAAVQLDNGVFYGVREGGALIAAGGTHLVSQSYGVAAVGSIFTRPEARGRGLATAVTAAVTAELLALPIQDVILNVAVENAPARAIYRRLGYRDHCLYWEGDARLRA